MTPTLKGRVLPLSERAAPLAVLDAHGSRSQVYNHLRGTVRVLKVEPESVLADAIALELNERPRQTLGFKTPSQAMAEVLH